MLSGNWVTMTTEFRSADVDSEADVSRLSKGDNNQRIAVVDSNLWIPLQNRDEETFWPFVLKVLLLLLTPTMLSACVARVHALKPMKPDKGPVAVADVLKPTYVISAAALILR